MYRQLKRWTPEEIARLESLVENLPLPVLASKFNRSCRAVELKARSLGYSIRSTLDNYSIQYLADNLPCSRDTITRWIRCGYLKAKRFNSKQWSISAHDFASFCRAHPRKANQFDQEILKWLTHDRAL